MSIKDGPEMKTKKQRGDAPNTGLVPVFVASLIIPAIVPRLLKLAPGGEADLETLKSQLRARKQSAVVVAGANVVFGARTVEAAKELGIKTLVAKICTDHQAMVHDERDLSAIRNMLAVSHFLSVVRNLQTLTPFELRLLTAEAYQLWVEYTTHRPPRPTPIAVRAQRQAEREEQIAQVFGRSQRSLERDQRLLSLPAGLRDAVRERRIPVRAIEPVANLSSEAKRDLTVRLGDGVSFAEAFRVHGGTGGDRRKTERAAYRFVRISIRKIVAELIGRESGFRLTLEDYASARQLHDLLTGWLGVPPLQASIDNQVQNLVDDLRRFR